MSYDLDIAPCENGLYGYGLDPGAANPDCAWTVYRWQRQSLSWGVVTRYRSQATARSEAVRRDADEAPR